jgi:hypothetical protein
MILTSALAHGRPTDWLKIRNPSAPAVRAKAAKCLEAFRQSQFLDQRRLYEKIAEQWRLIAEQMEDNAERPRALLLITPPRR